MAQRLVGKVAIVTGRGSGIGKATALLFAREGAAVVVGDIDAAAAHAIVQDIVAAGGTVCAVRVNVTQATAVEQLVATAVREYGKLDILFNDAGIGRRVALTEMSEDDWQQVIDQLLSGIGCAQGGWGVAGTRGNELCKLRTWWDRYGSVFKTLRGMCRGSNRVMAAISS
jgi:NAD(P)-dependent dehydrogenase (short-subunit alcohol dehydrogenase family)